MTTHPNPLHPDHDRYVCEARLGAEPSTQGIQAVGVPSFPSSTQQRNATESLFVSTLKPRCYLDGVWRGWGSLTMHASAIVTRFEAHVRYRWHQDTSRDTLSIEEHVIYESGVNHTRVLVLDIDSNGTVSGMSTPEAARAWTPRDTSGSHSEATSAQGFTPKTIAEVAEAGSRRQEGYPVIGTIQGPTMHLTYKARSSWRGYQATLTCSEQLMILHERRSIHHLNATKMGLRIASGWASFEQISTISTS